MSVKSYYVALPPIFVCQVCFDRVCSGTGYLAVNIEEASRCVNGAQVRWRIVHKICDEDAKAGDYRIYIRRFMSTNDLFLEMCTLSERFRWFKQTNWTGMVRRVLCDTERYAQTRCVKRGPLEGREDRRQKYLKEMQDNPNDHRHGTLTGYNSIGCRCERCKAAAVLRQRSYRTGKIITESPVCAS
jgi:hypothetical protein